MMELAYVIGNPMLRVESYPYEKSFWACSSGTRQLTQLFELQIRIQGFCDSQLHLPPQNHWHSNSEFRDLQAELDEYLLQKPDEFCSTQFMLHQWIDKGSIEYIHCALIWHCCAMILNRTFLPIRTVDAEGTGCLRHPTVPKHFSIERRNVCFASANTVATICSEVMTNGSTFPVSWSTFTLSTS